MSAIRVLFAGTLSAVTAFGFVTASGCATDAKGVDDCRKIEQARCDAGKVCGFVEDIEACKRFYRDQCLHGLTHQSPGTLQVDRCVQTIRAAGTCATTDPNIELAACAEVTAAAPELTLACDVVRSPEKTAECSFLVNAPPPDAGSSAAAGAAGAGGAAGSASAGAGGAGSGGASGAQSM